MNHVYVPPTTGGLKKLFNLLLWGLMLAVLSLAWQGSEMAPVKLVQDSGNMWTLITDFFPPDFKQWRSYLDEMLIRIYIGIWGTLLAIVCAIPLG